MSRLFRLAYRVAQAMRLVYWRIWKPDIHGAKAVVIDPNNRVLLIRHSYGNSALFMLPGGGVHRGEDPAAALVREVLEETGICVHAPRLHGEFIDTSKGATNHISIFVARCDSGTPQVDGREIIEACWFALDALPVNLAPASRMRVEEVRDGRAPSSRQWK